MKKLAALFLALVIAVTILAIPTSAAAAKTPIWNGSSDTSWYTGDKTSYDISTAEQLAGLSELVNSGKSMEGVTINLTSDLMLNDTTNWENWYTEPPKNVFTPIGKSGNPVGGYYPFAGVFNGNGHTIRGLYVNSGWVAGLFGYLYCAGVSSVIIDKSVIIGYDNLKSKGVYVGGIVGKCEGSIICQCESRAYVYAKGQKDAANGYREACCGGIAGSLETENVTSAALGLAFAAGGMFANPVLFNDGSGGLIKNSGIVNCISHGIVNIECGTDGYFGGIAGRVNNGLIQNCLSGSGWTYKKGVGRLGNIYGGGICGEIFHCNILNSYYGDQNNGPVGKNRSSSINPVTIDATKFSSSDWKTEEFAQQLGGAFKYTKGERPYLVCDLRLPEETEPTSSEKEEKPTVSYPKPTATVKSGKATIKWNAVTDAAKYIISSKLSNGKYSALKTTTKTTLTLSDLIKGKKYTIMVQANLKDGTTVEIGKVSFTVTPEKAAKDGTFKMTIFGDTYTGKYTGAMTSSRVPNGKGAFTCKLSDGRTIKYSGQFKKGIKSGTGVLKITYSNGDIETYKGKWVNDDLPDGTYSLDMSDGEYLNYRGKFMEGLFNGTGVYTYTYPNGDTVKYEGSFVNDKLNGVIKVTYSTRRRSSFFVLKRILCQTES